MRAHFHLSFSLHYHYGLEIRTVKVITVIVVITLLIEEAKTLSKQFFSDIIDVIGFTLLDNGHTLEQTHKVHLP